MILEVIFANSVDPDQQSDQGPHCLPVYKNRFQKFVRIFSKRHKQRTFSDAGFLGILRVNVYSVQCYNIACTKCPIYFISLDNISKQSCVPSK